MSRAAFTLLALMLPALPSCSEVEPKSDLTGLARGNNQFAVDLFGKLRTEQGNLFFSPYSLSSALAMTSAGAKGDTLELVLATPGRIDGDKADKPEKPEKTASKKKHKIAHGQ